MSDLWVFGYASLMWKPGFDYVEKQRARLYAYHRALCISSWEHRGTRERPGLVMGLDYGGSCVGVAFRVSAKNRDATLSYLRARELITNVYQERFTTIRLASGHPATAVVYVADREHEQYAGRMSVDTAVHVVHGAVGDMGPNEDYVINTADHLKELGIRDAWLEAVAEKIRRKL